METNYSDPSREILPGKHESFWLDLPAAKRFPPLREDITVDAAVVGGGIAGLTTAYFLRRAGLRVAVLEMRRILEGVTGHTTAKLTSAHGLIYHSLISEFGEERARMYADANQTAIGRVESLSRELGIPCDFERMDAYTYTSTDRSARKFRDEARAAKKLGLPASFTASIPLPCEIKGAVRFRNQARFHPCKFLRGLAERIPGEGSAIFEQTRVLDIEEGLPCRVLTDRGTVRARDVVLASNYPFVLAGMYFARLFPYRSYVLGVRLDGPSPAGMFYSEDPYHTVRPHPVEGAEILLVGGRNHKTGHGGDTAEHYREVERYARRHFPVASIEYWWSTQDSDTPDRVPYIGKLTPGSKHLYVATGFGGWGMTHGIISGLLISDLILGRRNPWEDLYHPSRIIPSSHVARELVAENVDAGKHLVVDRLKPEGAIPPGFPAPGGAGIVDTAHGKAAVHRSADGALHAVTASCSHLGCILSWNSAERSWDCPCHGSRFSADGALLQGPAVKDLERKEVREG